MGHVFQGQGQGRLLGASRNRRPLAAALSNTLSAQRMAERTAVPFRLREGDVI